MRFITCRLPDGVEDPAILSADGRQVWPLSWLGLRMWRWSSIRASYRQRRAAASICPNAPPSIAGRLPVEAQCAGPCHALQVIFHHALEAFERRQVDGVDAGMQGVGMRLQTQHDRIVELHHAVLVVELDAEFVAPMRAQALDQAAGFGGGGE